MDYTFHELPDMDGNGKRKVYPRAHRNSRIGSEVVFSIMRMAALSELGLSRV